MFGTSGSSLTAAKSNPNNDFEVDQVQPDGISSLAFSPTPDNFLVATSWNNEIRFWQVMPNGQSMPKAMTSSADPLLCCAWGSDNQNVFFAGADKAVKHWIPSTNQTQQLGTHDSVVKEMEWVKDVGMLCTGSWDRTLRWWDPRSAGSPKANVSLPERCYSMSAVYPLLVVACGNRGIVIYDLRNPATPYKTVESSLREQTRSVACFPDRTGFAVGSIEGRVSVQHVEEKDAGKNFAFRCHRVEPGPDIYAVNQIRFHPGFGTFATCGGDGVVNFWDKEAKQRLKLFASVGQPISASNFNHDGTIFGYAASYDWYKGSQFYNKNEASRIFLHAVSELDIKPRGKKNTR
ncbi:unnamed protein product (mitochondrion) [Plasmodiophora brassicae]|uniref:Uncharacterized protein n=1 Tax=Plasmodiophora brassicae TaxID=37360 RepID=A0A0G4IUV4_PLABS|nr:hypothetical protein PBRA_007033 [Plasmodiophora brassicae]SPQ92993.1 unnamed protein product [Plasmodiophora brassicae]